MLEAPAFLVPVPTQDELQNTADLEVDDASWDLKEGPAVEIDGRVGLYCKGFNHHQKLAVPYSRNTA